MVVQSLETIRNLQHRLDIAHSAALYNLELVGHDVSMIHKPPSPQNAYKFLELVHIESLNLKTKLDSLSKQIRDRLIHLHNKFPLPKDVDGVSDPVGLEDMIDELPGIWTEYKLKDFIRRLSMFINATSPLNNNILQLQDLVDNDIYQSALNETGLTTTQLPPTGYFNSMVMQYLQDRTEWSTTIKHVQLELTSWVKQIRPSHISKLELEAETRCKSELILSCSIDAASKIEAMLEAEVGPFQNAAKELISGGLIESALQVLRLTKLIPQVLDETDHELIQAWINPNTSRYMSLMERNLEAMCSARRAEKALLVQYRDIYSEAVDLSIRQVTKKEDNSWVTADIKCQQRFIDVKNARRCFTCPNRYSEFLVPRAKKDRAGRRVIISAVLSPYRASDDSDIVWIGEMERESLNNILKSFNRPEFRVPELGSDAEMAHLPPWMFDYPAASYRHLKQSLLNIKNLCMGSQMPIPLPIAVRLGLVSDTEIKSPLHNEALLLQTCIESLGLNRPTIFLYLLSRFCVSLQGNFPFYTDEIRSCIFISLYKNKINSGDESIKKLPLLMADPLGLIDDLLDVLGKISRYCKDNNRLQKFTSFRYQTRGILQGQISDGEWITIIAYCGGWGRHPGGTRIPCGMNPLYLGRNSTCNNCSRLICHKCGHCDNRCPSSKIRQDSCGELNSEN